MPKERIFGPASELFPANNISYILIYVSGLNCLYELAVTSRSRDLKKVDDFLILMIVLGVIDGADSEKRVSKQ